MNNEDFDIVANYDLKELQPVARIGVFFMGYNGEISWAINLENREENTREAQD